jgi:hypothetical protein
MHGLYLLSRRLSDFFPVPLWLKLQRPIDSLDFVLPDWWPTELPKNSGTYLEIGPGKSLATAIRLWLNGNTVTVWDLYPWLNSQSIAGQFLQALSGDCISSNRKETLKAWLKHPKTQFPEGFIYSTGLVALRELQELRSQSVDCVYSIRVMEHIPVQDLHKLLRVMIGFQKSDGIGLHLIDHSFHATHAKGSGLSIGHLAYSNLWWRLFHSQRLYHENRLRACDFHQHFIRAGFTIKDYKEWVNPTSLQAMEQKSFKLSKEFLPYSAQEICVDQSLWVISSGDII